MEATMRYMLLIYTHPAVWGDLPKEQVDAMMAEYAHFTKGIADSGELISGEPLTGTETATTVRTRDGKTTLTDGPFAETKEHLAGYYLVDVKDLDRALELAAQIPDVTLGSVEVRPIMELGNPADFAM
jgi:hypothetical protein